MAEEEEYKSTYDEDDGEEALVEEEEAVSEAALAEAAAVAMNLGDQLLEKIGDRDALGVQQAIRNGADVNRISNYGNSTPLMYACWNGYTEIVRILLLAGADARWKNSDGQSAMFFACSFVHFPTIETLLNHDNDLMEFADNSGNIPLIVAVHLGRIDAVQFLLDCGANVHATDVDGMTTLMHACAHQENLDIVRMLIAAGANAEFRDKRQRTVLHHAAQCGKVQAVRELIREHNANMFAVDNNGNTPFDEAHLWEQTVGGSVLLEMYGNKLTQYHGRLALHELLNAAEYSFTKDYKFHPPLNSLRIILPLGKLTVADLRTLLHYMTTDLMIRNRDDTGKLPIHRACQTKAPVEVLALILEHDPATLHIADSNGNLPLHECCGSVVDDSSVRLLVEQGGVGTLAARNRHEGALPLHILCGSTNPSLRTVQYLIQSSPRSVTARTNEGLYPFMIAACKSSTASLSVVYALVCANPDLVVLH